MAKVAVALTMSLDGYIAGPNDGGELPLGEGGEALFEWSSMALYLRHRRHPERHRAGQGGRG
jgi:hypothetical protein